MSQAATALPPCPTLLQARASQFLADAGAKTFDAVPQEYLEGLASQGYDIVYLLGVWTFGAAGLQHSIDKLRAENMADLIPQATSSCFAIQSFSISADYGGNAALARLRGKMNACGLRLLIDFIPNHVAVDHEWVLKRPELFVLGTEEDFKRHGNNRYFPLKIPLKEHKEAPAGAAAGEPSSVDTPGGLAPPRPLSEVSGASTAGSTVAPGSVAASAGGAPGATGSGTASVGAPDSIRAADVSSTHASIQSISSLPSSASPPTGSASVPLPSEEEFVTIYVAHGREMYAPGGCGWRDTAQLDYRSAALKSLMAVLLCRICSSGIADGVRSDMSMLCLEEVFRKTWGDNRVELPAAAATALRKRRKGKSADDAGISHLLSFSSTSSSSSSSSSSSATNTPAGTTSSPVPMTSNVVLAASNGSSAAQSGNSVPVAAAPAAAVVVPAPTVALPPVTVEPQPPQPGSVSTASSISGAGALGTTNNAAATEHHRPGPALGPGLGLGVVGAATRPQGDASVSSSSTIGSDISISIELSVPGVAAGADLTLELGELSNLLSPKTIVSERPLVQLAAAAADPGKMSDEAAAAVTGMLANQVKDSAFSATAGASIRAKVVQDAGGTVHVICSQSGAAPVPLQSNQGPLPPAAPTAAAGPAGGVGGLASATATTTVTAETGSSSSSYTSTTVTITMEQRTEFWREAIAAVKKINPGFLLLAEVYWGHEEKLLDLGFDYVYDKESYDKAFKECSAEAILGRLKAMPYSRHLRSCRFTENHDENRAVVAHRGGWMGSLAAAVAMLTTPCLRFIHDGQTVGLTKHHSVHVGPRAPEPTPTVAQAHPELPLFYSRLLQFLSLPELYGRKTQARQAPLWSIGSVTPSRDGNASWRNLIAYFLSGNPGDNSKPDAKAPVFLVVVNYSSSPSDGHLVFATTTAGANAAPGTLTQALDALLAEAEKPSAKPSSNSAASETPYLVLVDRLSFPVVSVGDKKAEAGANSGTGSAAAAAATAAVAAATAAAGNGTSGAGQGAIGASLNSPSIGAAITLYGKSPNAPFTEAALAYPAKLLRSEGLWVRLPSWGVRIYQLSSPGAATTMT